MYYKGLKLETMSKREAARRVGLGLPDDRNWRGTFCRVDTLHLNECGILWDHFDSEESAKIVIDGAIESANIALDFDDDVMEAIKESLIVDDRNANEHAITTLAIEAVKEYNQPVPSNGVA